MIITKYAAIDIGSNAVRLLISMLIMSKNGNELPKAKKVSLVRVPCRLGEDVFPNGKISNKKKQELVDTMRAFSLLLKVNGITRYRACATSAMREASNGQEIADLIYDKTGVEIDIIDGKTEAHYIQATDLKHFMVRDKNYLFVDVGGGSTEFTMISKGKIVESASFQIGTVRHILGMPTKDAWSEAEAWVRKISRPYKNISLIGSGGNINSVFKSSGKKNGTPLSREYLKLYAKNIGELSYEDRVMTLGMKPDRADVIVPALDIYINALKWAKSLRIYVPKIGLADGVIKVMINEDYGLTM